MLHSFLNADVPCERFGIILEMAGFLCRCVDFMSGDALRSLKKEYKNLEATSAF